MFVDAAFGNIVQLDHLIAFKLAPTTVCCIVGSFLGMTISFCPLPKPGSKYVEFTLHIASKIMHSNPSLEA